MGNGDSVCTLIFCDAQLGRAFGEAKEVLLLQRRRPHTPFPPPPLSNEAHAFTTAPGAPLLLLPLTHPRS